MRLEYRHNNGYDSVILVESTDDGAIVRSDWTVTEEVMRDFCACDDSPDDWDNRGGNEHLPHDYGKLVAVREGHTLRSIAHSLWNERIEFFCK